MTQAMERSRQEVMAKPKLKTAPHWVKNLQSLMDKQGENPRSLSLKAGLNPTAVRDMIEGRSRFPRYDTVLTLAQALNTTPAVLMSDPAEAQKWEPAYAANLDLMTEIITRLQEVAEDTGCRVMPRDFAAMVGTIYQRLHSALQSGALRQIDAGVIGSQIHDLLAYEKLRQTRTGR